MKTLYPNKLWNSSSFNLTAVGREILKERAKKLNISQGDYIETLIKTGPVTEPGWNKVAHMNGGQPTYYSGKTRGKTTAVCLTEETLNRLNFYVKWSKMSRGDYIETLLRQRSLESITRMLISQTKWAKRTDHRIIYDALPF